MTTPIQTLISKEELLGIGQKFSGQASPISPFFELPNSDKTQRMPSAALVNADGTLQPALVPVFQTLQNAQAYGLVAYSGNTAAFEASLYYPPAGSLPPVSLSVAEGGLKLQSPPEIAGWVKTLGQYLGESVVNPLDLQLELDNRLAQVFFGVVDTARRKMMRAMADADENAAMTFSAAEVTQTLSEDNALWISAYFTASLELSAPSEAETKTALQNLAQKGLVSFNGEQISLSETVEQAALTCLTLNGHLRLHAAALDAAKNAQQAVLFGVQGQSGAVVFWTVAEGSVDIFSASPAETMLLIGSLLEAPANVFSGQPFPAASARPAQVQPASTAQQAGQYKIPAQAPKKKRKVGRWLLIGFILLLVLGCLLVVGNWIYWEFV